MARHFKLVALIKLVALTLACGLVLAMPSPAHAQEGGETDVRQALSEAADPTCTVE